MPTTPKGLATVAFLKTRLDEGHDHLGLFEPLVSDALLHMAAGDFIATDVREVIGERTGIVIPANTVQTLLGRCVKRGVLHRQGGRFFRTSHQITDTGLEEARPAIERDQTSLATSFIEYAAAQGVHLGSVEDALAAVATFISDNKVTLVLEEALPESPLERSSLDRKLTRTVARFITERCLGSQTLRPALAALTEGILLQDVLLLRDIPEAAQSFKNLSVLLDTGILFAAIDLTGVANGVAAKEGLTLLREAGARTIAFSSTVEEMRQILAVYEQHVGTTAGRLSLYPTALTHHVLTARLSPADIRVISATLENRLKNLGVTVRAVPAHEARYTLDEAALAQCLINVQRPDTGTARIRHDVDSIAGVLTLRAGRTSTSIERSVAIFSTTSGRVVRNVQQWFVDEGENGVPPIIHHAALTSIAWLKKPAAAPSVKMHELAAVCVAAMRPTRATWEKVVTTLRRLRTEGSITDDETAAVVASELTEPLLARLDDDFEPDADSIQEAIERVREEYRREVSAAAQVAVSKAQQEAAVAQRAAEEVVRTAKAEVSVAQQAAADALAVRDQLVGKIEARVSRWSKRIAAVVFWSSVTVLVVAAVLSYPGTFESVGETGKWIARAVLIAAGIWGIISAIRGTSLRSLREAVESWVGAWIRSRWLPAELPTISDEK